MDIIKFTIHGEPAAKGRPCAILRNGHIGGHYTPEKTARYENRVALAARQAMGGREPFGCAVSLVVFAYLWIPGSWSLKKQRAALQGLQGE